MPAYAVSKLDARPSPPTDTELAQPHGRIEGFATRAIAEIDRFDFDGRQQFLRQILEDVKVRRWQGDLNLRILSTTTHSLTRPSPHPPPPAGPNGVDPPLEDNRQRRKGPAMTVCVPYANNRRSVPRVDAVIGR